MATTKSDTLNYRGVLYTLGLNATPFLNMIGGLNGGRREASATFSTSVTGTTSASAQTVQSEDTAGSAGTPTTYTKTQSTNTTQIMKRDAEVTFKKAGNGAFMGGVNNGENPSQPDSLRWQRDMAIKQLAKDVDYSFLQGTYVAPASTATAGKTRGIIEAITTNTTSASSANLSKALVDGLLDDMSLAGAPMDNLVIVVNGAQKVKISNIYGFAPTDRNVGGVNIKQLETDFGNIGVVLEQNMPTTTLLIAEMSVVVPVFNPISFDSEQGVVGATSEGGADVIWVPTGITSAKFGGFYYTQIGLDYGPEEWHGTLTSLAV